MRRHTKATIVATLGPASSSARVIGQLLEAGVNVFRLNFSHGTHEDHARNIDLVRRSAQRRNAHVGILADLQGPKIRTGATESDRSVHIQKGARVRVVTRKAINTETLVSINYPRLSREMAPGQDILLNDGAVRLRVQEVDSTRNALICTALNSGVYGSHKGVNFPGVDLSIPALTAKDKRDLEFILSHDVDFIALSFVRRARDLMPLRKRILKSGKSVKVIAKIEKPEALGEIDDIITHADGLMVARGDLGVEMSYYRVPVIQKDLVAKAGAAGKLVIVATQMLESMIHAPRPTRAELTDVANAILDGTDAIMLSGETAVGAYPAEAVHTMARIAESTESSQYYRTDYVNLSLRTDYPPHAVCEAAERAARDLGSAPVIVFTWSGDTALYLAKIRNQSPIYAFTPFPHIANLLSLAWNTSSFVTPVQRNIGALVAAAEKILMRHNRVQRGELAVVVSGMTVAPGATNLLRIKRIGEQ
jgi:pyruvate kinase